MQRQFAALQKKYRASTQVLKALAASEQTSTITKSLQAGDSVASVARAIKANSLCPTSTPHSRTCDACKFRRQQCDSTKPACWVCRVGLFCCEYTNTPASQVNQPKLVQKPIGTHEGDNDEKRGKRLESENHLTLDTNNSDLPLTPFNANLSSTVVERSLLPSSRSQKAIVSILVLWRQRCIQSLN